MTKEQLIKWLDNEGFIVTIPYVKQDSYEHLEKIINAVSHPQYKINIQNYLRLHKLSLIQDC